MDCGGIYSEDYSDLLYCEESGARRRKLQFIGQSRHRASPMVKGLRVVTERMSSQGDKRAAASPH